MLEADDAIAVYGTSQPPEALREVSIGALTFLYSADAIRRICWHGVEVIRAIAWPMRDVNWGTHAARVTSETLEISETTATGQLAFSVADDRLSCALHFRAERSGALALTLDMRPTDGPFRTNRSGFTVLHPIQGVAGTALRVTHSDGRVDDTVFPRLISPGQPVMDIAGLSHSVAGRTVDILFDGEVFEMEDQRNWSDASYKTYCVPLVAPFAYDISAPIRQSINVSLGGAGAEPGHHAGSTTVEIRAADGKAPDIGLVVEPGWLPDAPDLLAALMPAHLLVRLSPNTDPAFLADIQTCAAAADAAVAAEIVLDAADLPSGLAKTWDAVTAAGLSPTRILALTEAYLASHQPVGPWPDGPTPAEICKAVRAACPGTEVGGGMMTNFTEFNRCRPAIAQCDYVAHANSAIVHAGDDLSVVETLEALPQIFESTAALSGGKPCHLGLLAIGMRSNPYGADVAPNPDQIRQTMARIDPRHRGLFGAAYAVGVLAAAGGMAASLCLAAPTGPFGAIHAPQAYAQAGFGSETNVYPIYHVIRSAAAMAGKPRLSLSDLPEGIVGTGVLDGARKIVLLANTSASTTDVDLPGAAAFRVLDRTAFAAATRDPDWTTTAEPTEGVRLPLGPFATAFVTLNDP